MTVIVPVPAFAVAAYAAARIHHEDPADVFDEHKRSRARIVAVAAVKSIFPSAATRDVMLAFGWDAAPNAYLNAKASAMSCSWWDDAQIAIVVRAVRKTIRSPGEASEPAVYLPAQPEPRYSARQYGLVARTNRQANVTAYLMGDPGASGGIRVVTDQRSRGV